MEPTTLFIDSKVKLEPQMMEIDGVEEECCYLPYIMTVLWMKLEHRELDLCFAGCHVFDPNYEQVYDWLHDNQMPTDIIANFEDGYKPCDTILLIVDDIMDWLDVCDYYRSCGKLLFVYESSSDNLLEFKTKEDYK